MKGRMKNECSISGDITTIYIKSKGKEYKTLIDTEDLDLVSRKASWCITTGGKGKVYVKCWDGTKLHRLVTGAKRGQVVDHKDGDTLNNTRGNLRIGTQYLNMQNQPNLRSDNTSGLRGVYWRKDKNKWCAEIKLKGKKKHLGYFNDKEEAQKAVVEGRQKYMEFSEG